MAEFPVPLDNLIAYVKALHPDGGPLDNVTDAFAVSARLDEQSDALIGYFVDQARKSGASWSQIGGAMGVSKQAAQKRFVPGRLTDIAPGGAVFSRFTQRARNVLAAAGRIASGTDSAIGAADLAAATFAEPEGLAARAIVRAGLTADQVYAAVGAGPAAPGPEADADALQALGFDESGKAVLKATLRAALRLAHNYIGTEHLLLGVIHADVPAGQALMAIGLTPERTEELLIAESAEIQEARRRAGGSMPADGGPFAQFTERAARVLVAAGQLAASQPFGGTHLAAALLSEPEGLAAKAIAAAGLTAEQVYAAVGTGPAPQGPNVDSAALRELTLDDTAKAALKDAQRAAQRLGHNYVGTEHLLLGLLFVGGPVTEALSALGLPPQRAEQLIAAEIAAFRARREAG
jgi:ATP-dependent Clp protease ATP-binding subunit ClpA